MIAFWVRVLIVFMVASAQSVLGGLGHSDFFSIDALLLLALVWMLLIGFTRAIGWIIFLGIVSDMLFFTPMGFSVAMFVAVTYVMSNLTRQFLVAHALWGKMVFVGLVVFAAGVEGMFRFGLDSYLYGLDVVRESVRTFLLFREWALVSITQLVVFAFLYFVLSHVEVYLSFYERRIKPKNYA